MTRRAVITQQETGEPFAYHEYRADDLFGFQHVSNGALVSRDWPNANLRYFGVENETEYRRDASVRQAVRKFTQGNDGWLASHDGSLVNGVEFVSQPRTLAAWRKHCQTLTFPTTAQCGVRTGLHVHVSRSTLSPMTIAKLIRLVGSPMAQEDLDALARRRQTHYCRRQRALSWLHGTALGSRTGHAAAVNTSNLATVELRIWKATKRASDVLAAVELADVLCDFSAQASAQDMTWYAFLEWLCDADKICKSAIVAPSIR